MSINPSIILLGIDLIEDLVDEGLTEEEAIERTAEFLDVCFNARIIPEPYGEVVETIDGIVFELFLKAAWTWVKNDEKRKARRAERKAKRQARREARKAR